MNVTIHPNSREASVDVTPNPHDPNLIRLHITEAVTTDAHLVLRREAWQQVADQLAAHGIIAANHAPVPF